MTLGAGYVITYLCTNFLRFRVCWDVWIRTQSAAAASWRATNLATHPSLARMGVISYVAIDVHDIAGSSCETYGRA